MANNNSVGAFEDECKVINLTNEYTGATKYDGKIKFAIATSLSEEVLLENFSAQLKTFSPYVLITWEMYEAFKESYNNDKREQLRSLRYHEVMTEDLEESLTNELSNPVCICESTHTCTCILDSMNSLPKLEKSRLNKVMCGYKRCEIAEQEGTNYDAVDRCIRRASGKMRDTFNEYGVTYRDYRSLKRGDIVTYDFGEDNGSIQGGYRPAVILQDSKKNNPSPVVTIVPITTRLKKPEMIAHVVLGRRFGLKKDSMVLLEQVRTVNKCSLGIFIGHIDDPKVMQKIDQGLCKSLGIKSGNLTTDNSSSEEVSA